MNNSKDNKKQSDIVKIEDLLKREVWFSKISFNYDKAKSMLKENSDEEGIFFNMPLQISVNWGLGGRKQDGKGIIIGCNFAIKSEIFDINVLVETRMEFRKVIIDEQLYKDCFFQILAAKIYFPYIVELVAANTSRMDCHISPIILENELLEVVLKETVKKGPLQKP